MRNVFILLVLFFVSILDVAFFSRFHIFKLSFSISPVVIIFLGAWLKRYKDCFWAMIPTVVFSVFSRFHLIPVFISFVVLYFAAMVFSIESEKYFKKNEFGKVRKI